MTTFSGLAQVYIPSPRLTRAARASIFVVQVKHFMDNFERLMGLHGLYHRQAAPMIGVSVTTIAKWKSGERSPSFPAALQVAEFFGVPADRLANALFEDLLENELADAERYRATERRIKKARTRLKSV